MCNPAGESSHEKGCLVRVLNAKTLPMIPMHWLISEDFGTVLGNAGFEFK